MDAAAFRRAVVHPTPDTDLLLDRLLVDDGRSVIVRPVLCEDAPAEQLFVRTLSPLSRLRRFHNGVRELAPGLLHALTDVDLHRHVAIVALHEDEGDEPRIVADARYVMLDDCCEAEFAVAVADDWQGIGLGQRMMSRLLAHARAHGVSRLVGDVLHDNVPMQALVRRAGGQMVRLPGDATLARARFVW